MTNPFTATVSVTINATPAKVWEALTSPVLIKEYLFGTNVTSDWKVGSPITYKGEWKGKPYEDKGEILEMIPEKKFASTYWSGLSGKADIPENYATVTYELEPTSEGTTVTLTQADIPTEDDKKQSQDNWEMVLKSLKGLLEK